MTNSKIKSIGIYTSGGDAPGMNAALRATVRYAIVRGLKTYGIYRGYVGMLAGEVRELVASDMANIIQRGGTIIKTDRCPEFLTAAGRKRAAENLKKAQIDALVCIGGDGSFSGAYRLAEEHGIPVVGIPATIDNDIYGTDVTVGFDTAINTALTAIDNIRDTADSHNRLFIVEVMGRNSGYIALNVGVAGGAEEVFIPENPVSVDQAVDHIRQSIERGKTSSILVAAEGQKPGRAYDLAEALRKKSGFEAKVCILGHIQRGGRPTASDRLVASQLGAASVQALLDGYSNHMVGIQKGEVVRVPLKEAAENKKPPSVELLRLTQLLAT